jgi:serine protease Do
LAVLRVKDRAVKLQPVVLGESSKVRLGEVVLAIGNPFGVGQTVTMGIVSAKGRADVGITAYEDFIQTDAAINPGNSGGALINMRGELVGINTAILSRTGGSLGIGFAIPPEMATPIMQSLLKSGRVDRGFLGVSIQDVTPDLATALKLSQVAGVLISDVQPGGPAARGGLARGDVVLKVNGQAVDSTGRLRNAIAAAGARNKAKLDIVRAGRPMVLDVVLGDLPADESASSAIGGDMAPSRGSTLDGLTLENLTETARRAFRIPKDVGRGVVVTRLDPGSPAARAGLRPGDVLLEVDRRPVENVDSFRQAWTNAKGKVALLVNRRGSTIFVVVSK